jgi:hypothetical protein
VVTRRDQRTLHPAFSICKNSPICVQKNLALAPLACNDWNAIEEDANGWRNISTALTMRSKRESDCFQQLTSGLPRYSHLTAESLLAEADTADTNLVHGRAVELQAHDHELRGIENFRVPRRLKGGERCADRLEHNFPIVVETLVVDYRELREFLFEGWWDRSEPARG